jgi:hypothetical protein
MRLSFSSFRVGDRSDLLVALAGRGARVAVIANPMDDAHRTMRDGQVLVIDGDSTTLY